MNGPLGYLFMGKSHHYIYSNIYRFRKKLRKYKGKNRHQLHFRKLDNKKSADSKENDKETFCKHIEEWFAFPFLSRRTWILEDISLSPQPLADTTSRVNTRYAAVPTAWSTQSELSLHILYSLFQASQTSSYDDSSVKPTSSALTHIFQICRIITKLQLGSWRQLFRVIFHLLSIQIDWCVVSHGMMMVAAIDALSGGLYTYFVMRELSGGTLTFIIWCACL